MIQFIKVRNVKNPVRDVNENAGIDFYIPENEISFINDLEVKNKHLIMSIEEARSTGVIVIPPHQDILIPSGIKSKFDKNIALIANNKSGIATKKKLVFGASVIDSSYQGEWHLHLINTSDNPQEIEFGQKIIQFIPHYISMDEIEILDIPEAEFFTEKTNRGSAGFGNGTGIN